MAGRHRKLVSKQWENCTHIVSHELHEHDTSLDKVAPPVQILSHEEVQKIKRRSEGARFPKPAYRVSARPCTAKRGTDLNEGLHARPLDERAPPVRDGVAPRPQHEPAPRLVAPRRAPSAAAAPSAHAARRRARPADRLAAHGVAGRLVEGTLRAAHVSVLPAKVRGDAVGGAGADSVPVAQAPQPLALVRSCKTTLVQCRQAFTYSAMLL